MLKPAQIRLIDQEENCGCAVACISMVTGISQKKLYESIESLIRNSAIHNAEIVEILVCMDILPISHSNILGTVFMPDSVCIGFASSKTMISMSHCIVVCVGECGEIRVLDPAKRTKRTVEEVREGCLEDLLLLHDCSHMRLDNN